MLKVAGCALLLTLVLTGCGRREHHDAPVSGELRFEQLDHLRDTSGLSRGVALLTRFEPYRMANGVMRVRGDIALPDGTVLQLAVYPAGGRTALARVQFDVRSHHFDTPPIIGERGTLPTGDYQFEVMTFFDSSWQPAPVVDVIGDGRALRGPGVTRDRLGRAAYAHSEEHRL